MLKILEDDYINEAHDKTVADTSYRKAKTDDIKLLASSYRKNDPSLSLEESLRMAAYLMDPEHIVSIEDMMSDIPAQETESE